METEGRLAVFVSDFDAQLTRIREIYELLAVRSQSLETVPVSAESVESTGYWLHNLYCAYEDLFKMVSAFWENNIAGNGGYHVNLLNRMSVEIQGVRPPVLSRESYASLDELRGFRHVFRHAYSYGLDDERVSFLLRRVMAKKETIIDDLIGFRKKVESLIEKGPVPIK